MQYARYLWMNASTPYKYSQKVVSLSDSEHAIWFFKNRKEYAVWRNVLQERKQLD